MLNDRLVIYIERDVFLTISNDVILTHFQQMHRRRGFHCIVLYQTMLFLIFNIVCIFFFFENLAPHVPKVWIRPWGDLPLDKYDSILERKICRSHVK